MRISTISRRNETPAELRKCHDPGSTHHRNAQPVTVFHEQRPAHPPVRTAAPSIRPVAVPDQQRPATA